jgi:hypothetical protein
MAVVILRAISALAGLAILFLIAFMLPLYIGPYVDLVLGNSAVQAMGFDTGVRTAIMVGSWIIPLLGLGLLLWLIFGDIIADVALRGGMR